MSAKGVYTADKRNCPEKFCVSMTNYPEKFLYVNDSLSVEQHCRTGKSAWALVRSLAETAGVEGKVRMALTNLMEDELGEAAVKEAARLGWEQRSALLEKEKVN